MSGTETRDARWSSRRSPAAEASECYRGGRPTAPLQACERTARSVGRTCIPSTSPARPSEARLDEVWPRQLSHPRPAPRALDGAHAPTILVGGHADHEGIESGLGHRQRKPGRGRSTPQAAMNALHLWTCSRRHHPGERENGVPGTLLAQSHCAKNRRRKSMKNRDLRRRIRNAERQGFEPWVVPKHYAELAIRCIRPLCHLSGGGPIGLGPRWSSLTVKITHACRRGNSLLSVAVG